MADLTEARFAAKSVEYETPQDLFDRVNAAMNWVKTLKPKKVTEKS
jgi:hypothetical protein